MGILMEKYENKTHVVYYVNKRIVRVKIHSKKERKNVYATHTNKVAEGTEYFCKTVERGTTKRNTDKWEESRRSNNQWNKTAVQ